MKPHGLPLSSLVITIVTALGTRAMAARTRLSASILDFGGAVQVCLPGAG